MKKKLVTLVTVVVATLGMVGMASAGEYSAYVWVDPGDVGEESADKKWGKDESWYEPVEGEIIIAGFEYGYQAYVGFKDGAFGNKDLMKEVGGVSFGMECQGRLVNASYDDVYTPWMQDGEVSKEYSIKNTGTDVDWKFTVKHIYD
ncbi:MAG: hypothetical protein J6L69_01765 [Lachnospiraceae bacterium]|nr:hypothetical protein [Lachnospiraceae bacterium]